MIYNTHETRGRFSEQYGFSIWPSAKEVRHCIHEERRIQNKCLVADSGDLLSEPLLNPTKLRLL